MIAKHVQISKVSASSFRRLAKYLLDSQGKANRVGEVRVTNCGSDENDPMWAVAEVEAVQRANTRARTDKTYHLTLSFRAGEEPDPQVLKELEDRVCEKLGYREHQRISVIHRDTEHLHIHIAINKIHPRKLTILDPYYGQFKLGEICASLEDEYRLEPDNHACRKKERRSRTDSMERAGGVESVIGFIRRECADKLRVANTWEELLGVLAEHDLEAKTRGNGLVICAPDGVSVKASSIARDFSIGKLEERLGIFPAESGIKSEQAKPKPGEKTYRKRPMPMRTDTGSLWTKYRQEMDAKRDRRASERARLRQERQNRVKAAKSRAKLARMAARLVRGKFARKVLCASARSKLRRNLEEINESYGMSAKKLSDETRRTSWIDWLRDRATGGDQEALKALRARQAGEVRGNIFERKVGASRNTGKSSEPVETVTRKGGLIYRLEGVSLRDDGKRLQVGGGASREGLKKALEMAVERYGEELSVRGSNEFKEAVIRAAVEADFEVRFTDEAVEKRRLALVAQKAAKEGAAGKYAEERNSKRWKIRDIEEHRVFSAKDAGVYVFGGLRRVDGEALALLEKDGVVFVTPVLAATEARLKRCGLGEMVSVSDTGHVERRGRKREGASL